GRAGYGFLAAAAGEQCAPYGAVFAGSAVGFPGSDGESLGGEDPLAATRRCRERNAHPLPAIEAQPPNGPQAGGGLGRQRERSRRKVAAPPCLGVRCSGGIEPYPRAAVFKPDTVPLRQCPRARAGSGGSPGGSARATLGGDRGPERAPMFCRRLFASLPRVDTVA